MGRGIGSGRRRLTVVVVILLGAPGLAGCAGPSEPGRWQPLDMARLRLAPVALEAPLAPGDRRPCRRARAELQAQLVRRLPGRLGPVDWVPQDQPASVQGAGALHVAIVGCRITSHQWDVGGGEPDITFYQTLRLRVRLTAPDGEPVIAREVETVESVHTDLPTPAFAFFHDVAARRVAGLFSRGRVWEAAKGPGP